MDAWVLDTSYSYGIEYLFGYYPSNGESNGKEHGLCQLFFMGKIPSIMVLGSLFRYGEGYFNKIS